MLDAPGVMDRSTSAQIEYPATAMGAALVAVAAKAEKGGYCANFAAAHGRIDVLRAAGVRVVPMTFPLPAKCDGAKQIPRAWTFLGSTAESCPCSTVPHEPNGVWVVPPDTTIEDVRRLHASAR